MVNNNCQDSTNEKTGKDQNVSHEMCSSDLFFDNLIWLTTKEAALFLRTTIGALHTAVSRGQLRARKFRRRLFFNKNELVSLIETSELKGGHQWL